MNKILILLLGSMLMVRWLPAQVYSPIAVTGFNHDVVAEGSGNSSLSTTTIEMDAVPISNFVMCTQEFADANGFTPAGLYGLPDNGLLASQDRSYQFAPYDGNNVLYLFPTQDGLLTLATPARYTHLSLLALSTEGSSTIETQFNFSDGTTQTQSKNIFDWFDNTSSPFNSYGRLKRKDGPFSATADYAGAETGKPVFATLDFTLPCEKTLVSISITNTSASASSTSFRSFILAVAGLEIILTPTLQVAASDTTVCEGTPITFTASSTNGGTAPVYQWKVNNISAGTNSTAFTSSSLQNGDKVTCTLTSNLPCAAPPTLVSRTITLEVKPLLEPKDSITVSDDSICAGTPVTFEVAWQNGGPDPQFRWFLNNTLVHVNTPTFTSDSIQNNDRVYCQLISNAECLFLPNAYSNLVEMQVTPVYQLSIGAVDTLNMNEGTVTLAASPPGGVFSGHGITGLQFDPAQTGPGTHTVTYSFPDNPCTTPVSREVVVRKLPCDLTPVNLVTRNRDGRNDLWEIGIYNSACILNAEVEVYNRWGKRVFHSDNYRNDWSGADLVNGSYFFTIRYKTADSATELTKTGIVTLWQ